MNLETAATWHEQNRWHASQMPCRFDAEFDVEWHLGPAQSIDRHGRERTACLRCSATRRGRADDTNAGQEDTLREAPRYPRNRPCIPDSMSNFWAGTIAVIITTLGIFALYWFMMFRPARRRQSKPDHRT